MDLTHHQIASRNLLAATGFDPAEIEELLESPDAWQRVRPLVDAILDGPFGTIGCGCSLDEGYNSALKDITEAEFLIVGQEGTDYAAGVRAGIDIVKAMAANQLGPEPASVEPEPTLRDLFSLFGMRESTAG